MVANNGVYASGEKSLYQLVQFISKTLSSVQNNTSPASGMILDVLFVLAVCSIVSWSWS
jgi:Na+-translocating ferredoxin:NAD+ oxidoreductase RnfA subunit